MVFEEGGPAARLSAGTGPAVGRGPFFFSPFKDPSAAVAFTVEGEKATCGVKLVVHAAEKPSFAVVGILRAKE